MSPYAVITEEILERKRARQRQHYAENRERLAAKKAEYAARPEVKRARAAAQRRRMAAERERDPEGMRAKDRALAASASVPRSELARRYRQRNPEKVASRAAVSEALRIGVLTRPSACPECGGTSERIEAHHHRGYAPERALDVVWLCRRCHREADRRYD